MGLNDVSFVKGQGGLGRPLPGQDHISGLIYYVANGSLPSGFSTASRIKKIFSVADAEAAGIKADYNDETKATASFAVTAIGANGDTVELKVLEPFSKSVSLGIYTKVAGDTTTTLVATAIAALINAGTSVHGYTATSSTATVTITARKGLGLFLNTNAPLTATYSAAATLAGTITAFAGGVGSKQAVWHYHIAEYFRNQPQGVLYVGFFAVPSPYTFVEITTVQNFAGGAIRQLAVYKDGAAFATADITAIQTEVATNCDAKHKPLSVLYGADLSGTADLSTLTDLGLLTAPKVSAVIGQDGAGLGALLYLTYGKSITVLGALLGTASSAKVNESVAYVNKFNISNGTECDTIAFANGQLYTALSDNLVNTLNTYRYIFLRKFVGVAGSYFNDSHCAVAFTSDYAYLENNRTIDKAIRGINSSLAPELNGPISLNADGTIKDITVLHFTSVAGVNLEQMVRDSELSAEAVTIDTTQNVLSTSKLIVAVQLVQIGVARLIQVNIGFTLSL
jgi:hypothetical protein